VPIACDRATADFIISSPLMETVYERIVPDYDVYRSRDLPGSQAEAAAAKSPAEAAA
jgi:methylglyoxal synthase